VNVIGGIVTEFPEIVSAQYIEREQFRRPLTRSLSEKFAAGR
jgi:hypothetical protein